MREQMGCTIFTTHYPTIQDPMIHDSLINHVFLYMPWTDLREGQNLYRIEKQKYFIG